MAHQSVGMVYAQLFSYLLWIVLTLSCVCGGGQWSRCGNELFLITHREQRVRLWRCRRPSDQIEVQPEQRAVTLLYFVVAVTIDFRDKNYPPRCWAASWTWTIFMRQTQRNGTTFSLLAILMQTCLKRASVHPHFAKSMIADDYLLFFTF